MNYNYESIAFVTHADAAEALSKLNSDGEAAVVAYLKQWYEPGEGTMISSRDNPWKDQDQIYEDGEWVLYYNTDVPYFGLVCRMPIF